MFTPSWDFVWTIVNLLILFLVLRKLLFKRVTAFMDARSDSIAKSMEAADGRMAEANEIKGRYEALMRDAEKQAAEILAAAKLKAEDDGQAILREARREAGVMLERANVEIRRQQAEIVSGARRQIVDIALSVSSKVLLKDLDERSNAEFIERVLEEEDAAS
jgi:F-type H+-transporting ATPase subunit b